MHDSKSLLNNHLSDQDYAAISASVSAAYIACSQAINDNPILGAFLPGQLLRSNLITPYVDHALTKLPGFLYEFQPNAARNWYQTTFYKSGLALTSHYLGSGKNMRSGARKAVVRGELNKRNGDLFAQEAKEPDATPDFVYCHVLHGGFAQAQCIALAVPNRNQTGYFASTALEIVNPEETQVEEIREEVIVKLLALADQEVG